MITKEEFKKIDSEVKSSLEEAFDFLKNNCVDYNYIIYLADGEYHEKYRNSDLNLNPYTIDNRGDRHKDLSRQNFFIQFMKTFYSFQNDIKETFDDEYILTMELMVYTHLWESKPFLRQLYRLADLINGKSYSWKVSVPDMSKHIYIRKEIRDILKSKNLSLANIITNGFHTSLRNAFAHSEYQIDIRNKFIYLDTFKGGNWDIERISFDDWTIRFVYSALFSYHFLNLKAQKRAELVKDFGTNEFLIIHPITENRFTARRIYYDVDYNRFSFYKFSN